MKGLFEVFRLLSISISVGVCGYYPSTEDILSMKELAAWYLINQAI